MIAKKLLLPRFPCRDPGELKYNFESMDNSLFLLLMDKKQIQESPIEAFKYISDMPCRIDLIQRLQQKVPQRDPTEWADAAETKRIKEFVEKIRRAQYEEIISLFKFLDDLINLILGLNQSNLEDLTVAAVWGTRSGMRYAPRRCELAEQKLGHILYIYEQVEEASYDSLDQSIQDSLLQIDRELKQKLQHYIEQVKQVNQHEILLKALKRCLVRQYLSEKLKDIIRCHDILFDLTYWPRNLKKPLDEIRNLLDASVTLQSFGKMVEDLTREVYGSFPQGSSPLSARSHKTASLVREPEPEQHLVWVPDSEPNNGIWSEGN